MEETTRAAAVSPNGHREEALTDVSAAADAAPPDRGLIERLVRGVARQVQSRIPVADLDERDPDYIRENLPGLWLLASIYFRGEVRGLGNIPDSGPVLLV